MDVTFSLVITSPSPFRRCRDRRQVTAGHRASAYPKLRHLNAAGHDDRAVPAAVAGRRLANYHPERPAEGAKAGEADVKTDLGDAAAGLPQQKHRALDSPPLQVAVRRLAEHRPEAAAEVG